jgi:hypothetical protein
MITDTGDRRATREQLHELHRLVAERLLTYFTETPASEIKATLVECAIAFLRLNDVNVSSMAMGQVREQLLALALPFEAAADGGDPEPEA